MARSSLCSRVFEFLRSVQIRRRHDRVNNNIAIAVGRTTAYAVAQLHGLHNDSRHICRRKFCNPGNFAIAMHSRGRISFDSEPILKIQKPANRARTGPHFIRRMFASICKVCGKNRFERDVNKEIVVRRSYLLRIWTDLKNSKNPLIEQGTGYVSYAGCLVASVRYAGQNRFFPRSNRFKPVFSRIPYRC